MNITPQDRNAYRALGFIQYWAEHADSHPAEFIVRQLIEIDAEFKKAEEAEL